MNFKAVVGGGTMRASLVALSSPGPVVGRPETSAARRDLDWGISRVVALMETLGGGAATNNFWERGGVSPS